MPFGSVFVRAIRSNVSCLGGWMTPAYAGTERVGAWFYPGAMAFAPEHPVLAHSEYRAVEEVVRTGGRFEVVSAHEPAGDQPAAIDELERRVKAGERDVV